LTIRLIPETKIITDQNRRISRTIRFQRKPRIYPHTLADRPLQGALIAAQTRPNHHFEAPEPNFRTFHRNS
jgi:hypothetical protein